MSEERTGFTRAGGGLPNGGLAWLTVLRISVVAIVAGGIVTMILLVEGFDPVIGGFMAAYLVGLALLSSRAKAGTIVIGLATLGFIGFGAPFFVPSLLQPKSSVEFAANLWMLVAGIVSAIAAVALLRRSTSPSRAARIVVGVAIFVLVFGFAFTTVVRLTLEEPKLGPDDLALTAENIAFSTDHLHANEGEISIVVHNADFAGHTFTIDKLDVDESLPGDASTRITFDAPDGTYHYYCSIPGHEETMHGTLTVHGM